MKMSSNKWVKCGLLTLVAYGAFSATSTGMFNKFAKLGAEGMNFRSEHNMEVPAGSNQQDKEKYAKQLTDIEDETSA